MLTFFVKVSIGRVKRIQMSHKFVDIVFYHKGANSNVGLTRMTIDVGPKRNEAGNYVYKQEASLFMVTKAPTYGTIWAHVTRTPYIHQIGTKPLFVHIYGSELKVINNENMDIEEDYIPIENSKKRRPEFHADDIHPQKLVGFPMKIHKSPILKEIFLHKEEKDSQLEFKYVMTLDLNQLRKDLCIE